MKRAFLLGAWGLVLLIPFASLADEAECIITRTGNTPLHGRKCRKVGKAYQIQSCDTPWICKARKKNVKMQPGACKDSTSAPKFMESYQSGNNEGIVSYLKDSPHVMAIQIDSEAMTGPLAAQFAGATSNQKVALVEFTSAGKISANELAPSKAVAQALTKKQIQYLYTFDQNKLGSLSAYSVTKTKLVKVPLQEAIPTCGD